jgi:hypothetical protein
LYVLANKLQQGKSPKAWLTRRARVGINLGIFPMHVRSVALVLSLNTELALPQFHTKHNNLFETITSKVGGFRMPKSHWQQLLGSLKKGATESKQSGPSGAAHGKVAI